MKTLPEIQDVLNEISPSFCIAKWHRTNLRLYNGTAYSCHHCTARNINLDKLKDDPSALTNTDEVLEFRQQMLDGERPSECAYCWQKEDQGLVSDRLIKSKNFVERHDIIATDTAQDLSSFPTILDVAFDNTCNFKCSYCGPANSSMWMQEMEQYGDYPTSYKKKSVETVKSEMILNREDNPYIEAFWKWWDLGLGKHLQRLTITGGEPLLSKHTFKVLDKIIQDDLDLTININTNLCVPDGVFNGFRMKLAKLPVEEIIISTSIESLGAQAEYSRYGLEYKKWLKNVHTVLQNPKVRVAVNLTNNALSYCEMTDALELLASLKIRYGANRIYISSNDVLYPKYLDIRVLPYHLRRDSSVSIGNFIQKNTKLLTQDEIDKIQRTANFSLTTMDDEETNQDDFKKFIKEYDKRRNLDYSIVFPYLKQFVDGVETKQPWCIDPFINFSHTADGYYRPCCIGTVERNKETGNNIKDTSPIEYFTGPEMQKLRREMLDGKLSAHSKMLCRQCVKNDSEGVKSRRVKQNDQYLIKPEVQAVVKKYEDPNYVATLDDLQYVNFKILGNLCNLKCLMCGPSASSKIAAEWKKHDIAGHGDMPKAELLPYDENSKDSYMKDFDKIISNISDFNMVGGEAFINPNFDEIWDTIINNDNVKNLKLLIITNGTLLPQKVLDAAHKFKTLRLLFSIDGVYERGSYVRSGLNWKTFDKNVKRALASDAVVAFTVATSMLNIGYLDDIYDYLKGLGVQDTHIAWDAVVTEPVHLRASNLPDSIKQQYIEKLKKHEVFNLEIAKFNTALDILQTKQSDNDQFLHGLRFLTMTDNIRNTDVYTHFPEFKGYL